MNAYLKAIAYYLPEAVLDNAALSVAHPEWSVDKISEKTGINERHIAAEDECSSDMAVRAAEKLFDTHNINRQSIDFILLCTQSPDYFLPTTACILQHRLGLPKSCGALDFNLGCSGFVYGLGLAKGLIATGQAKNILLLTSETYSKFIHPDDKSNKTLFGDAAAAVLISAERDGVGNICASIGNFVYGTDGSGAEHLIVRNGGMRHPEKNGVDILSESGFERNDDYLYMDGKAIFNFTAFQIPALIKTIIDQNGLAFEAIDRFVLHQANAFMLQTIRKRTGIAEEKMVISMAGCGNTVSSTIPIALLQSMETGAITPGQKVMICGFGVGLSMGGTVLNFL